MVKQEDRTSLLISKDTRNRLSKEKMIPGESFDHLINRMIDERHKSCS